jgi:hypothetical protein
VLALFYWELKRVKERGDMSRRTLFKKKKRDRKISFFFFPRASPLIYLSLLLLSSMAFIGGRYHDSASYQYLRTCKSC